MKGQSIKYIVFILLLFLLFSLVTIAFANIDVLAANLVWIVLIALFLVVVWKGDLILMLEEYQRAVIMRFGKVKRVGGPGWCIIIPFIEKPTIVDLRTQTIDIPKQEIITKSKIELGIDAVIYLSVGKDKESAIKSVIEVEDYRTASKLYVISALRDVLGSMSLDDVISNIEIINAKLKDGLKKTTCNWGIVIENVEIKDVDIPKIVLDSMHKEKAAEQEKLARMERAMAHEYEIETVKRAAENLSDRAMAYYYIRALEKLGEGKSTKFMFPMEITKLAESIGRGAQTGQNLEGLFKKYAPAVTALLSQQEKQQIAKKVKKKK